MDGNLIVVLGMGADAPSPAIRFMILTHEKEIGLEERMQASIVMC